MKTFSTQEWQAMRTVVKANSKHGTIKEDNKLCLWEWVSKQKGKVTVKRVMWGQGS